MKPKPATTRNKKAMLALVFFIMLMDVIGMCLFIPIAPYIVGRFTPEVIMIMMLNVIFSAAQFIAAPILGKLSDRFGRRPVLLLSLAGSAAGYVVFGFAGSLAVLFFSRIISGLAGGNMSTASAVIADVSEPHERAKNFTLVGMAWGIGLVAGPALGSALGAWSLNAPAFLAAALMALSFAAAFFLLPETMQEDHRDTSRFAISTLNPIGPIGKMLAKPLTGWLLIVMAIFNLAGSGVNNVGPTYLIRRFAGEQWQVGLLTVLVGVATALVQILLVPMFVPKVGERKVAAASLAGLALCCVAIFLSPYAIVFFALYVLMSGINGLIYPSMTTLITGSVEGREMGSLMGVMTALGSLMNIFGPLWAGFTFDHWSPQSPFIISATLFAAAFGLFVYRKFQTKHAPGGGMGAGNG